MAWFNKPKYSVLGTSGKNDPQGKPPKELWTKCPGCGEVIYNKEWDENLKVCPKCNFHNRLSSQERIELLADPESFREYDKGLYSLDPLGFTDAAGPYSEKLKASEEKTGMKDGIVCGSAKLDGLPVEMGVMDFSFMGGSMGSVIGEKICRVIDNSLKNRAPVILVSSSGGARMHEGIISLMQMAKTSAWLSKLGKAGVPFISLLTHPTTGGVTASFASIGDIIIAEPGALIGFAGPRVIEQTIRQKLPEGFQTSEFVLEHGFVDMIVERKELKASIARVLKMLLHQN